MTGPHWGEVEQPPPSVAQGEQALPPQTPPMQGCFSPLTYPHAPVPVDPSTHVPVPSHQSPAPHAFDPCVQTSPGPSQAAQELEAQW